LDSFANRLPIIFLQKKRKRAAMTAVDASDSKKMDPPKTYNMVLRSDDERKKMQCVSVMRESTCFDILCCHVSHRFSFNKRRKTTEPAEKPPKQPIILLQQVQFDAPFFSPEASFTNLTIRICLFQISLLQTRIIHAAKIILERGLEPGPRTFQLLRDEGMLRISSLNAYYYYTKVLYLFVVVPASSPDGTRPKFGLAMPSGDPRT
jgi:hypothetical protein